MSTLIQLITAVRDEISEPTPGFVSDIEVKRWLNRANYDMAAAAAIEAAPTATIVTADGTEAYNFPTDFGLIEQIELIEPNTTDVFTVLLPLTIEQRIEQKGRPQGYYVYAGQLYVVPKPDGVYSLRLWYYKQGVTLVNDTDVPIIPSIYHDTLTLFAISQAKRKGDDPAYTTYLQDYVDGRESMVSFLRRKGQGNRFSQVIDTDER